METPTIGIGRLLHEGGHFSVPHHQRDYSWTEDEIEQLFEDVINALDSGQTEYFIGLMVFLPADNREFIILDGQQRLATTTLILSSIRSWLRARDFKQDADQIQNTYIASRELGSDEYHPLLVLNENNNQYFERYVVREAPSEDINSVLARLKRYDPSRALLEAVLFTRSRIKSIVGAGDNGEAPDANRLFDLVRYLKDSVKVVRLNVPSEANAYTVFETLNDRGLELSVLDLVKNHIFGRMTSNSQLRDAQTRWSQMLANLANVPADDFLKAWWTSRHGRVQTAQLFPRFKNEVMNAKDALQISEDMLGASEIYAALDIADDPLWSKVSNKSRERIRALRLLGARQVKPVLLSAIERFEDRELERLLHLLEVLIVRYQLVGGGRTGRLEISSARLAYRIYQKEVKKTTEAHNSIRDIFPSDEDFKISFINKRERNSQKVRYLLSRLEIEARRARGESRLGDELEPIMSLTVEHIFPKSPSGEWDKLLEDDPLIKDECTFKLGNICLLTSVNRSLGNKSFSDKRETYKKSNLLLTSMVSGKTEWNRTSIEKRQSRLAKYAVAHWRFQ